MVTQIKGKSSLKGQNEDKLTRAVAGNNIGTWTPLGNYAAAQDTLIPCATEGPLFAEMEQQKAKAYRLLFRNEAALR